jgi:hypothetical protein
MVPVGKCPNNPTVSLIHLARRRILIRLTPHPSLSPRGSYVTLNRKRHKVMPRMRFAVTRYAQVPNVREKFVPFSGIRQVVEMGRSSLHRATTAFAAAPGPFPRLTLQRFPMTGARHLLGRIL